MEYQLTIIERPGHVHARITGPHRPDIALAALREAYVECVNRNCEQMLLEMATTGPTLGPSRIFGVLKDRLDDALKLRKIAYVDTQGRDSGREFVENFGRNRGVNIRAFATTEEAQRWLAET
jgi:hypothetical protein